MNPRLSIIAASAFVMLLWGCASSPDSRYLSAALDECRNKLSSAEGELAAEKKLRSSLEDRAKTLAEENETLRRERLSQRDDALRLQNSVRALEDELHLMNQELGRCREENESLKQSSAQAEKGPDERMRTDK